MPFNNGDMTGEEWAERRSKSMDSAAADRQQRTLQSEDNSDINRFQQAQDPTNLFGRAADIFDPPPPNSIELLPHQQPPTHEDSPNFNPDLGRTGWFVWLLMSGRGSGKTQAASHYVDGFARRLPGARIAIIAPTLGDARSACVDGPSGLKALAPDLRVRKTPDFYLEWPNGSRADIFGANSENDVERLRAGGNRHLVWAEELAAWRYLQEAWDQMEFGLRLGTHPHVIASTTPKNRLFMHKLTKDPKTIVTRGSTLDNPHLHETARERLLLRYQGTNLGRQELFGELLEDMGNTMWVLDDIENARWCPDPSDPFNIAAPWHGLNVPLDEDPSDAPFPPQVHSSSNKHALTILEHLAISPKKLIVAVDPATTSNEHSDSTGIVTVAEIEEPCPIHTMSLANRPENLPDKPVNAPCYLVLKDSTLKGSPDEWAKAALDAYHTFGADKVIAEVNNGGDLVEMQIRAQDPNTSFKTTRATRGKQVRAEPIAALYEQGRVHHLGYFPELEEQMLTWDPTTRTKASPDRLDALVWGLTEIAVHGHKRRRSGYSSIKPKLVNRTDSHWTAHA